MNTAIDLRLNPVGMACLASPSGKRKQIEMPKRIQPVRKVTVGESFSSGGTDPLGGQIFNLEYLDGITREVYLLKDAGRLLWEYADFLKPNRTKTNDPSEMFTFRLQDPDEKVSSLLVGKMKAALTEHNKITTTAAIEQYNKKLTP